MFIIQYKVRLYAFVCSLQYLVNSLVGADSVLIVYLYAIYHVFKNVKYLCSFHVAFIFLSCRMSVILHDS